MACSLGVGSRIAQETKTAGAAMAHFVSCRLAVDRRPLSSGSTKDLAMRGLRTFRASMDTAPSHRPAGTDASLTGERLDSWKEIATYLKRSVRTVHRWEKEEGLPVHRQLHKDLGSVFAYKSELDAWSSARSVHARSAGGDGRAEPQRNPTA